MDRSCLFTLALAWPTVWLALFLCQQCLILCSERFGSLEGEESVIDSLMEPILSLRIDLAAMALIGLVQELEAFTL